MTPPPGAGAQRPVRTLLIWLVLASLLPGLVGAITLFIYQYREGRAQLENSTLQSARALAHAVDSHLLKVQAVAQALAASDAFANNDLAHFHRQARRAIAEIGLSTNVVLRNRQGRQVLNTVVDFGKPLPPTLAPEQVQEVFATGRPTISDVFIGLALKRPIMSVDVPVWVNGRIAYALAIGILPEHFNAILKAQGLPPDWVAGVFDRRGIVFGRTHAPEQYVGRPAARDLLERMRVSPEGSLQATTSDGIPVLVFY
ncbi:MAG TPA: cache domain-containing protein, partial [Rhodocyclaceae bacterium]|nr:cache domain-containing protein [Rhodocyclaceae bacterium]